MYIVIRIGCLYNNNSSKQNLCVVLFQLPLLVIGHYMNILMLYFQLYSYKNAESILLISTSTEMRCECFEVPDIEGMLFVFSATSLCSKYSFVSGG